MEEKFLDMVGHEGALTAPKGGGTKLMDVAHLYQDFMEHGSVCLHIVDKQGVILWANNSELATLGYSQDEYIGRSIRDFHIDLEKIDYILSVLLAGGTLSNFVAPVRCKDGHVEYMSISSSMRSVDGEPSTTRCFSVCVTGRHSNTAGDLVSSEEDGLLHQQHRDEHGDSKEEEKHEKVIDQTNSAHTLAEKEELAVLFEDFMEFGSVGLHIVDNTGIIRWANHAEMDLLGYTREEYFGKSVTEVYADGEVLQQLLTTLLSGKKLIRAVTPLWAKDGHLEYVEINSSMRKVNGECSTTRCFSTCVTDRVLREQEEARAAAKEKEAAESREETRRKTDFLRKLCHELRNPLAGVKGNVDLLLEDLQRAESQFVPSQAATISGELSMEDKLAETERKLREAETKLEAMHQLVRSAVGYGESAHLATEHMTLVINDTLSLSRLESEGFEFSRKAVDVYEVLESVYAILGTTAQEQSVDFAVSKEGLPDQARFVTTDPVWLKQVLMNLVSNAIKFSTGSNHGRVDLIVSGVEQDAPVEDGKKSVMLQITVTDNGIGMTQEEQGRLFNVFAQANDKISSQFGGSGLGLYIVKQFLEHIGGTVSVQSEKGRGSSFTVKMPCEVPAPEEIASLRSKPKMRLKQSLSQSDSDCSMENAKVRVLVVDDSSVNRRMLAAFLRKRGFSHDTAENGLVALKMLEQSQFHVILTDIDMPGMDGIELTRTLRRNESTASDGNATFSPVPIIGISGNALPADQQESLEAGMTEYISKPYNFQDLEALILKHLPK